MSSDNKSRQKHKSRDEEIPFSEVLDDKDPIIDPEVALVEPVFAETGRPPSNRPAADFEPFELKVRVEEDSAAELSGSFRARLTPEGLFLRKGVVTVLAIPLDAPARLLGDARLSLSLAKRSLSLQVSGWRHLRQRLAHDLVELFQGRKFEMRGADYVISQRLLWPIIPCIALPAVALGAPSWTGLGVALALACFLLAVLHDWPVMPRTVVSWSLPALGYALLLVSLFVLKTPDVDASSKETQADVQTRLEDVQTKLSAAEKEVSSGRAERARLMSRIQELAHTKNVIDKERAEAQRAFDAIKLDYEAVQREADEAKKVITRQKEIIKKLMNDSTGKD